MQRLGALPCLHLPAWLLACQVLPCHQTSTAVILLLVAAAVAAPGCRRIVASGRTLGTLSDEERATLVGGGPSVEAKAQRRLGDLLQIACKMGLLSIGGWGWGGVGRWRGGG